MKDILRSATSAAKRIEISHLMAVAVVIVLLALVTLLAQAQTRQAQEKLNQQSPVPTEQTPRGQASAAPTASASPTASATPDQTVGWSTYRHQELGFSFKYPPTWGESSTRIVPGETGYAALTTFSKVSGVQVSAHSKDYSKPIGGLAFAFVKHSSGKAYEYYKVGSSTPLVSFEPTQVLTAASGQSVLIVGGQAALSLDQKLRGQQPAPQSFRYAFVNTDLTYRSQPIQGLQFSYNEIPASQESDFDLFAASFTRL